MRFSAMREFCWSGVRYIAGETVPVAGTAAARLVASGDVREVKGKQKPPPAGKQQTPPANKQQTGGKKK